MENKKSLNYEVWEKLNKGKKSVFDKKIVPLETKLSTLFCDKVKKLKEFINDKNGNNV